ncbi:MAG: hypothetical protein KAW45_00500 [Thermoplasmatales archaeon]|nr:hypothetical protein [Thermoplasmatales archaeon]
MDNFTFLKIYGYYIAYFLLFLLIEVIIVSIFLYPNTMNFLQLYLFIILLFLVVIFNLLALHYWIKINEKYILKVPENFEIKEGEEYIGIVMSNSNMPEKKLFFTYGAGLILFLEYLIRNKKPYKFLKENNRKNKFNKSKFRELVYDKNCKELYILGHGRRHALKISDKEFLYYLFYANAPPKKKVIQLHCNLGNYVSLSELLNADKDFKEKGSRWLWQDVIYFLKRIKD